VILEGTPIDISCTLNTVEPTKSREVWYSHSHPLSPGAFHPHPSSSPAPSFSHRNLPRRHTPHHSRHRRRCPLRPSHRLALSSSSSNLHITLYEHIWNLTSGMVIVNVWMNKALYGTLVLNTLLSSWTGFREDWGLEPTQMTRKEMPLRMYVGMFAFISWSYNRGN